MDALCEQLRRACSERDVLLAARPAMPCVCSKQSLQERRASTARGSSASQASERDALKRYLVREAEGGLCVLEQGGGSSHAAAQEPTRRDTAASSALRTECEALKRAAVESNARAVHATRERDALAQRLAVAQVCRTCAVLMPTASCPSF